MSKDLELVNYKKVLQEAKQAILVVQQQFIQNANHASIELYWVLGKLLSNTAERYQWGQHELVKEKNTDELLEHYQLTRGPYLTNLGILCLGKQQHRAQLATAPVIQFIKYDDREQKVNKIVWDDQTASPMELIESVWREIPDFREHYELPDGLYRQSIPAFDEVVIRVTFQESCHATTFLTQGAI